MYYPFLSSHDWSDDMHIINTTFSASVWQRDGPFMPGADFLSG